MASEKNSLPIWILVVSGLFSLLGLMVSSSLLFSPQSVLPTVDLNAKGIDYLIDMWAARQFALGFIFGFATYKRSPSMLTLAFIFFLVMNVGDFFIGLSLQDSSLYLGAGVMCVIASFMLYFIGKQGKRDH